MHVRIKDVPPAIRSEFFNYFIAIHDEEEDAMPPIEYFDNLRDDDDGPETDECDGVNDCFKKIGVERMAQIYREFLEQAPDWVRKVASDISQYEEDL